MYLAAFSLFPPPEHLMSFGNSRINALIGSSRGAAAVLVCALAAACQPERPVGVAPSMAPQSAKGGGSGGGTTADVVVTSTSPSTAPQDTTLDVVINGSGFGTGARATWSLHGDTTQVVVKSTKVISSTQLVATVVVSPTATVSSYDVAVALPGGKKGVGAEVFIVTWANSTADFTLASDPALGVQSDSYSLTYRSGECGVRGVVFASASGDANLQADNPRFKDNKCKAYPRKFSINYGDGTVLLTNAGMNLHQVSNAAYSIPVGGTALRALNISDDRCGGLRLRSQLLDGTAIPADDVLVTRVDARTYVVASQPYPANRVYCMATGQVFNFSVRFTVKAANLVP